MRALYKRRIVKGMKGILGFILVLLMSTSFQRSANKSKVIMVVVAHPDDEGAFAPVLAKLTREKNKVFLVIATDGRYGVEAHAKIPAGDSLASVRQRESQCACSILGIEPPIFLGAHDGFGLVTHIGLYFNQTATVKNLLAEKINQIQPDLIMTFGPDGDTGQPDHRQISSLVTELILREGWYEKYPLYYLGWKKEKVVSIPQGNITSLNYVHDKYLNVQIAYTEADRQKGLDILPCYKSQMTEAAVKDWIEAEHKDKGFTLYFRRFKTDTQVVRDFE